MADDVITDKRRKLKAKFYLSRVRGEGGDSNMAGSTSTGTTRGGETANTVRTPGEAKQAQPTTWNAAIGLDHQLNPNSDRNQKRNATSPLEALNTIAKVFKSAFSPKIQTPEHSNVYIDSNGMTCITKPGERIPLRNLAQQVNSPLPRFDPDHEVVQIPRLHTPAPVNLNEPVTLANIHHTNKALLSEYTDKLTDYFKKELKIRDDYMNQVALKMNACGSTLVMILERLAEYEQRIQELEKEVGTQDTPAQRRERMLRDVVLLVDGLSLADKETHEHRVITFLNERFVHPHGREFLPMDISCAYSVGKEKDDKTKTIKVVFQSAWLRRFVYNQRFKLKGTDYRINEELAPAINKMAFEARDARRNGLIKSTRANHLGVTLTTLDEEIIEIDHMDELFEVLASLSDVVPTVARNPNEKGGKKTKTQAGKKTTSKKNKKDAKNLEMSNEVMLQALRDKGLLKEGTNVQDLLKDLKAGQAQTPAAEIEAPAAAGGEEPMT